MAQNTRPIDSRGLTASVLLGGRPPQLSGKRLVALGELFGIAGGTTRVALSRMVRRGELSNVAGTYRLEGTLLARQQRQDRSRRPTSDPQFDSEGIWEQWVVKPGQRRSKDRAELRNAATQLNLAELRDGVWLRPANLDSARLPDARAVLTAQAFRFVCSPQHRLELAEQLFETDAWAADARALIGELNRETLSLVGAPANVIPSSFVTAASAVRHILHDPLLPAGLLPADWPGAELRSIYDSHERLLQMAIADFFSTVV